MKVEDKFECSNASCMFEGQTLLIFHNHRSPDDLGWLDSGGIKTCLAFWESYRKKLGRRAKADIVAIADSQIVYHTEMLGSEKPLPQVSAKKNTITFGSIRSRLFGT